MAVLNVFVVTDIDIHIVSFRGESISFIETYCQSPMKFSQEEHVHDTYVEQTIVCTTVV